MANKKYVVAKGRSIFGHKNKQIHEDEEITEEVAPLSQLPRWIKTGFAVEKKNNKETPLVAPALPAKIEDGERPDERKGTPEDGTTASAKKIETEAQAVVKGAKAATLAKEAPKAPKNPPKQMGKWNIDPSTIVDKKLAELNVMIRERGGEAVKDIEEARLLLSADYKG